MPNPSVEDVLQRVKTSIREGAGLPLDDNALDNVEPRYRDRFHTKLQEQGSWDRDGLNVLNAALQLGIIATSIARLHREGSISREVIRIAGDVVRTQCSIGDQEGQWCP